MRISESDSSLAVAVVGCKSADAEDPELREALEESSKLLQATELIPSRRTTLMVLEAGCC